VASIVEALGSSGFARVRLGIGRPPHGGELAQWVLEPVLDDGATRELQVLVERGAQAVAEIVTNGAASAMERFNAAVPGADRQGQ
jgi:PTH1 family peptidyl-tRNA hydrolase